MSAVKQSASLEISPVESVGHVRALRIGRAVSWRYHPRAFVVTALMVVAVCAVVVLQVGLGDFPISPSRVVATFAGHGTALEEFVVYDLRMPRAATAVVVGLCLGVSGAIFQSLTRNPLGSPDIIGFTQGASVGAVVTLLLLNGSPNQVALGATVGGLTVSVLVYGLAYRNGVQGYRLILVGIGFTAVLSAAVSYLLLISNLARARQAFIWLTGSLNGAQWSTLAPVVAAAVVLLPLALMMTRSLRLLEMGDDIASGLGVSVERSRLMLLVVGTTLCAVAVSATGPIGFIALAAPQVAKRLTGGFATGLISAGVMGALLLCMSDVVAQRLFGGVQLPVGVATLAVGGIYLAWLLFNENKSGRA